MKWSPFCYYAKALCVRAIEQSRHVTIIHDGGAQEIWKQKYAILNFVFLHYRHSSGEKIKTNVIARKKNICDFLFCLASYLSAGKQDCDILFQAK